MSAMIVLFYCIDVNAEPLINIRVYNEESKSYFELIKVDVKYEIPGARNNAVDWIHANQFASRLSFKGVRGRLAVVRSQLVNNFLRDTFKPDLPAWIGLRYFCKQNAFMWVTGQRLQRTDYQNWGAIWNTLGWGGPSGAQRVERCKDFIPVHYWPADGDKATRGFRWNANGRNKAWYYFFVEYPTGEP